MKHELYVTALAFLAAINGFYLK